MKDFKDQLQQRTAPVNINNDEHLLGIIWLKNQDNLSVKTSQHNNGRQNSEVD